jgi:hypothetical protein
LQQTTHREADYLTALPPRFAEAHPYAHGEPWVPKPGAGALEKPFPYASNAAEPRNLRLRLRLQWERLCRATVPENTLTSIGNH